MNTHNDSRIVPLALILLLGVLVIVQGHYVVKYFNTRVLNADLALTAQAIREPPPETCGNGFINDGEECDDGRFNGLHSCSRWCEKLYCGDGIVQVPEECEPERDDEGNFIINSCGRTCTIPLCDDDGENCVGGCRWSFQDSCTESSESSSASGAQLSSTGSVSSSGTSSLLSVSSSDASSLSTSLSSTSAFLSSSSSIISSESEVSSFASSSSSSVIESQQLFNNLPFFNQPQPRPSSSSSRSRIVVSSSSNSLVVPVCGNGVVEGVEECDDGRLNSDRIPDICRTSCKKAYCGDGVLDTGELCDDGNDIIGDGCTPTCQFSVCGNGELEVGEECDNGRLNNDRKPNTCSQLCLMPRCGDGVVDDAFAEVCDDGDFNSDDRSNTCRTNCLPARCGDGVVDDGEQCDDGNTDNDDGCSNVCQLAACGNGVLELDEECDDGNEVNGDGCSACTIDPMTWSEFLLLMWQRFLSIFQ